MIKIKPFSAQDIPAAATLLAQRHQRDRAKNALLPQRFEDPGITAQALEILWEKKYKKGFAAWRGDKLQAYLLGENVIQPWGRCGYVHLPGYAVAHGENPALLQDLYARLGDDWVRLGVFSHGIYIIRSDEPEIEAFFDLGFGKERVDALLQLHALDIPTDLDAPQGVTIRRAEPGDNEKLGSLSPLIMQALANAPYWHPTIPEDYDELREGWSELADDANWKIWLALDDGVPLGCVGFIEKKPDAADMLVGGRTVYLSVAATVPSARGQGIANLLTWRGLKEARHDGYQVCYTNWISPNLLASRYWRRYGFQDCAYRLARRIDPMIAWTANKPGL